MSDVRDGGEWLPGDRSGGKFADVAGTDERFRVDLGTPGF